MGQSGEVCKLVDQCIFSHSVGTNVPCACGRFLGHFCWAHVRKRLSLEVNRNMQAEGQLTYQHSNHMEVPVVSLTINFDTSVSWMTQMCLILR